MAFLDRHIVVPPTAGRTLADQPMPTTQHGSRRPTRPSASPGEPGIRLDSAHGQSVSERHGLKQEDHLDPPDDRDWVDLTGAMPPSTTSEVETILDSIADGVFTVDRDWRITSFNRAAERITGVAREKAIGQKCFDVLHASICQSRCALRHTVETGEPVINQTIDILNTSGERVPVSISTAVLRDRHGNPVGGVETFRDLSTIEALRNEIDARHVFHGIISKNAGIRRILDILPDVAESDTTILIQGATGSGKELFARAIHELSGRASGPYVAVNCGAIPDTLLESELFGYYKGAFTDARRDKPGRFALADGGTLMLDEVGDISPALQTKLLRVLQQREYEPLGGTKPLKTDVRLVAATNQPLDQLVAEGRFREDLYYRLNVLKIDLPPLAQRREDIPLLAESFLRRFAAKQDKTIAGLTEPTLRILLDYDFPGNVRELENMIERAVVLCRQDVITPDCLPPEILDDRPRPTTHSEGTEGDAPLAAAEARAIVAELRRQGGHRRRTAEALGIDKTTLWRKMKRLRIEYPS
jgi:PAS domain S-box-containing protein